MLRDGTTSTAEVSHPSTTSTIAREDNALGETIPGEPDARSPIMPLSFRAHTEAWLDAKYAYQVGALESEIRHVEIELRSLLSMGLQSRDLRKRLELLANTLQLAPRKAEEASDRYADRVDAERAAAADASRRNLCDRCGDPPAAHPTPACAEWSFTIPSMRIAR